jgi:hypothetical protein
MAAPARLLGVFVTRWKGFGEELGLRMDFNRRFTGWTQITAGWKRRRRGAQDRGSWLSSTLFVFLLSFSCLSPVPILPFNRSPGLGAAVVKGFEQEEGRRKTRRGRQSDAALPWASIGSGSLG